MYYNGSFVIPTTKCFGIPNHFESSIYSREKVWQSPNLFRSGIDAKTIGKDIPIGKVNLVLFLVKPNCSIVAMSTGDDFLLEVL